MNSFQTDIIHPADPKSSKLENSESEPFAKYKNKLILDVEQDIIFPKPNVSFSDIAGLEHAKRILLENIIYPFRYPQLFVGRYRTSSSILLYGSSGTGKRLLIQACANEIDVPLFVLETQDLLERGPERASKKLKKTFEMAKATAPSILYIDDIASLFSGASRKFMLNTTEEAWRSLRTECLIELNPLKETHVIIFTTSQKPWLIEPHVRRRFKRRIYCPLPEESARKELITKQSDNFGILPLTFENQEYLIKGTKGFSALEIKEFFRRACYEPIREAQQSKAFKVCGASPDGAPIYQTCDETDSEAKEMSLLDIPPPQLKLRDILREDFERVRSQMEPSVNEWEISKSEDFRQEYGEE